ncbi:DUF1707 SHOCT-like domain-containing protein [Sinosporangium album]|nr:DUF1707 domain-containing protein [Sinosporangium album]
MRASDADRDRVAAVLREHYAEGRLNVEEFDERLDQVYRSKTHGELGVLTRDLPHVDLRAYTARATAVPEKKSEKDGGLKGAWAIWAMASGINWVIWLAVSLGTWEEIFPWPLLVMGPWGVALLVSSIAGRGRDDK